MFFIIAEKLANMSDADFNQWQRKLGYRSLKSVQDSLVRRASEACSEVEFYELLSTYGEFITLHDSVIQGVSSDPFYVRMCNAEGYLCIDSVFYHLQGDNLLGIKGSSIEEAKAQLQSGQVLFVVSLNDIKNVRLAGESCAPEQFSERLGPDGDRRVQLRIGVKVLTLVYNTCHYVYKQCWYVKIDALRTNFWGQWYHYDTDIAYAGIAISLDKRFTGNWFSCYSPGGCYALCSKFVYGTPVVESLSDRSYFRESDGYFEYVKFVGDSTQNTPITSVPMHFAKGIAWTRGTTEKNYAKVCCNYPCPWP